MKNITRSIVYLTILSGIFILFLAPAPVCQAATNNTITDIMKGAISKVALPTGEDPDAKAQIIVGKVIGAFLSVFGIIFMILIIYGGYKWMMASGREEELKKAKDTIRAAIIGLIIILASYAIAYFVTYALQTAVQ